MRHVGKIIAGVVVIGLVAGVFVGSAYRNKAVEKKFVEQIANLNRAFTTKDMQIKLEYDALKASGFFWNTKILITNPRESLVIPGKGQPDGSMSASQQSLWKTDGTMELAINYLKSAYTVHIEGSNTLTMSSGAETLNMKGNQTVDFMVQARSIPEFYRWDNLSVKELFARPNALQGFKKFSMSFNGSEYRDPTTSELMVKYEPGQVIIVNRSTETMFEGDLISEIHIAEVSPKYAAMMNSILRSPSMMQLMGPDAAANMPVASEEAGKQDYSIDASIRVPSPMPKTQGCVPMAVQFRKMEASNNTYNFTAPGSFESKPDGVNCAITTDMDITLTVKPAAAEQTQRFLDVMAASMAKKDPQGANLMKNDAWRKSIYAALPNVITSSPIRLMLKMQASFPPEKKAATVHLERFAFLNSRWGLESNALVNAAQQQLEVNLVCRRCEFLTRDLMVSAMQIQALAAAMKPGSVPPVPLDAKLLANINALLNQIGQRNAAGDLSFNFRGMGKDATLNGQPMATVMGLVAQQMQAGKPTGR